MGRLSRKRKIKAIDPFSKTNGVVVAWDPSSVNDPLPSSADLKKKEKRRRKKKKQGASGDGAAGKASAAAAGSGGKAAWRTRALLGLTAKMEAAGELHACSCRGVAACVCARVHTCVLCERVCLWGARVCCGTIIRRAALRAIIRCAAYGRVSSWPPPRPRAAIEKKRKQRERKKEREAAARGEGSADTARARAGVRCPRLAALVCLDRSDIPLPRHPHRTIRRQGSRLNSKAKP